MKTATPPLLHPNSGVFLLSYIVGVVAPRSKRPKLLIRAITFEVTQPIHPWYINVTDRRTDGLAMVAISRRGKNTQNVGYTRKLAKER